MYYSSIKWINIMNPTYIFSYNVNFYVFFSFLFSKFRLYKYTFISCEISCSYFLKSVIKCKHFKPQDLKEQKFSKVLTQWKIKRYVKHIKSTQLITQSNDSIVKSITYVLWKIIHLRFIYKISFTFNKLCILKFKKYTA